MFNSLAQEPDTRVGNIIVSGTKTLASPLTQVQLIGTTFNGGTATVFYE